MPSIAAPFGTLTAPWSGLNIAKGGPDWPADTLRPSKAQLTISVGETYDVEFTSTIAEDLLPDLLLPGQKIHTTQTLSFVSPTAAAQ